MKFCGECGAALTAETAPSPAQAAASASETAAAPASERRLVSVLFADLVGHTTLSEGSDAEEVRELLSRYYAVARTIVGRYGGTVEKFIGDAVMAVWGTPVAQEDDAERAVRAGLEIVAAVPDLDPRLQARAGVLTGEAAVTIGAEGEGMVAGDLVNTASRIQSAAEPGAILVGESTKRAAEAAIAFEDAGAHELKGKARAQTLWRALRVVANRGGEGRSTGLEAPFVGRDRELRLVKNLFHSTADGSRAALVSVLGVAGIGKSRLAWEFEKYADGVAETVYWHHGRCLSYGDGVAYWALAEMVRGRAGMLEDESPEQAVEKVRALVAQHFPEADERAWLEPRLLQLLGLTDGVSTDRDDLFSAWRRLFERLAEQAPVVLVFEDLHWADTGLVAFVDHLLDWSRNLPIFVLTQARPEIAERHPGFPGIARNASTLVLEPLADEAMDELLLGLVPGLPDDARTRIRERADGIPLYAVETVRMLLDRGLLEPDEGGYRPTGPLDALDIPETLHALIAARLDSLQAEERLALERAAVLGKTFTVAGLAAISDGDPSDTRALLDTLVRKELLAVDRDPRSPERGQYGFLQALVQRVAYETLSRRERREAHLASARYLEASAGLDPDEIAEVIATHYVDALEVDRSAPDAEFLRVTARDWLCRAGERAAGLAATDDARRAFDAAGALAAEPEERARLLERAGELANASGDPEGALERLEEARTLFEQAGSSHAVARVAAEASIALWGLGRGAEALERLEPALDVLATDEPDEDVARLAAEAARIHHFQGAQAKALERVEQALAIAEAQNLPVVLSDALNTKSLVLSKGRPNESRALMREALAIALDHDLVYQAIRAYNNLAVLLGDEDRPGEARSATEAGFELARARGHQQFTISMGFGLCTTLLLADGDWDGAFALADEIPLHGQTAVASQVAGCIFLAEAALARGARTTAETWVQKIADEVATSSDVQLQMGKAYLDGILEMFESRYADAIASFETCARLQLSQGFVDATSFVLHNAATAALASGDAEAALPLSSQLDEVPEARLTRAVEVALARIRGNVAAARHDNDRAAESFGHALGTARNLGQPPDLGPVLVDYARWLVETGRAEDAAPLLAEARELWEKMGAVVWLERIGRIEERMPAEVAL
jgi:class 3 adenylate cyclase/tetratricopeptide (TPR) repeat protein